MATLDSHPEAVKQAALADRLVVTKVDRVSGAGIAALEERLRALNPGATMLRSANGDADPAALFDTGLYRGAALATDASGWLNAGAYRRVGELRADRHDPRIVSFVWRREEPLAWDDLHAGLEALLQVCGAEILRLNGLVAVAGEPGPRAVHAVQHALYPAPRLGSRPGADQSTRLV